MTEFLNELSENQINYLKQQKKHKYIVGISRILILFSFLFLWEFTANVGIIDSFIFSSPSKIALCFWGMVLDKSIFLHTNVTLYETILSFLLVTATSILVTILLWFSRRLSEILDPYLVVLNSLPKSALAPLLIVWLGATKTTPVWKLRQKNPRGPPGCCNPNPLKPIFSGREAAQKQSRKLCKLCHTPVRTPQQLRRHPLPLPGRCTNRTV